MLLTSSAIRCVCLPAAGMPASVNIRAGPRSSSLVQNVSGLLLSSLLASHLVLKTLVSYHGVDQLLAHRARALVVPPHPPTGLRAGR